jgi:PKD repeat protein
MRYLSFITLISTFFLFSCSDDPSADFEMSESSISPGDHVKFTNKSINTERYEWDFGDGHSSDEVNPIHTYNKEGEFEVVLTAYTEDDEESFEATGTVEVTRQKTKSEKLRSDTWTFDSLKKHYVDQGIINSAQNFTDSIIPPKNSSSVDLQKNNQYVFRDSAGTQKTGDWILLEDDAIRLEGPMYINHSGYYKILEHNSSTLRLRKREYQSDTTEHKDWILVFSN